MRILMLCDAPVPHPRMNYRADPLVAYLASHGHDVSVVCAAPDSGEPLPEPMKHVRFIFVPRYAKVEMGPSYFIQKLLQIWLLAYKSAKLLRSGRYDIIRPI